MGASVSEHCYITGEVDYRVIRFDQPVFSSSNLCLRYPTVGYCPDESIKVNYDPEHLNMLWLSVSKDISLKCNTPSGMDLRQDYKTKVVLLEGDRNLITGSWTNINLLKSKILPITLNYAMK